MLLILNVLLILTRHSHVADNVIGSPCYVSNVCGSFLALIRRLGIAKVFGSIHKLVRSWAGHRVAAMV